MANLDQIQIEIDENPGPNPLVGTYKLRHVATGRYMDTNPGGVVKTFSSNNNADQHWQFIPVEGSYYNIDNLDEGRGLLDADDNGTVKWVPSSDPTEFIDRQWLVEAVSGQADTYRFKNKREDRGYLTVQNNVVLYNNGTQGSDTEWQLEQINNARVKSVGKKEELSQVSLSSEGEAVVYPNPSNGEVTIRKSLSLSGQAQNYFIMHRYSVQ